MLGRMRSTLTYANVMSTIALFGVLGGGAYAAARIGPDDIKRNAVRSKHIKKNQVGRKHLKRNAVSAAKIASGAVTNPKIGSAAVTEPKIASGAVTELKIADAAVTGAKVNESTLETVPNADRVDGIDAADLLRGRGDIRAVRGTDAPSGAESAPFALTGAGSLTLECRNPASAGSEFRFTNGSGSTADVWTDKLQDGSLPATQVFYNSVPDGGHATVSVSGPAVLEGRALARFTIAVGDRVTVIEARIVFAAGVCSFNAVATEMTT
jgi:hypothetical protein